jgi:hypothetical protein
MGVLEKRSCLLAAVVLGRCFGMSRGGSVDGGSCPGLIGKFGLGVGSKIL